VSIDITRWGGTKRPFDAVEGCGRSMNVSSSCCLTKKRGSGDRSVPLIYESLGCGQGQVESLSEQVAVSGRDNG
jgi:hypothetical protein